MRIAILAEEPIGAALGRPLAEAGHDVVLAPSDASGLLPVDVVVVASQGPEAEAVIEGADARRGGDSFVVALVPATQAARAVRPSPTITVGELSHNASARVVRLARALEEAGVPVEVSLDIHSALARLREPQEGSAGGEGSDAWRRC
jgi:hypothetical protein